MPLTKMLVTSAGLGLLSATAAFAHADTQSIEAGALVSEPQIVDCTLETGAAAKCAQYVVKYLPDALKIGPFCPATLDDAGGIWDWDGDNPGLYRVDGDYLRMLADQGYTFFNDAGEVYSFDIRVEGPSTPHECISGSVDPDVTMTVLIPVDPVIAQTPAELGTVAKVGLALDGVPIFADAPSVIDRGHMPALDTCGGHVDPGGWYHWHSTATDVDTVFEAAEVDAECLNVAQDQTAQFGYAFDGFAMLGTLEFDGSKPAGIDACGGHIAATSEEGDAVYHYHASDTFPNLPSCLVGVVAQDNFSTTAAQGIGSSNGGGRGGPDFEAIGAKLGIDPELLQNTLRQAGGPRADLDAVAQTLGVSVEDLRAAMPGRNR